MTAIASDALDGVMSNAFAYPRQRKYPICSEKHARASLLLAARPDTFGTAEHVREKVRKRYPHLLKKKGAK